MRVLLRHMETGLFYAGPAAWTSEQSDARDFYDTARALDAASAEYLGPIELVMSFEDPKFDIPLTVVSLGK